MVCFHDIILHFLTNKVFQTTVIIQNAEKAALKSITL